MKVLNLQCQLEHSFEGWFSSEQDFASQIESGALICPLCGDSRVHKLLSAPRLNLRSRDGAAESPQRGDDTDTAVQAAWMEMGRRVIANTDDVGGQFAEEARKIHYGEVPVRGIRGKATAAETESLIDEGVPVLPFLFPEALKRPLQ